MTATTPTTMSRWQQYLALCKPKVVVLMIFTAAVGMLLAAETVPPARIWVWGLLGIGLAAGAGAALNHWADAEIDAHMARTQGRPLPQGWMQRGQVIGFALAMATVSMLILSVAVNLLTAGLTLAAMIGYAIIYSIFLKRLTPQNIVLGGAAGAAPPVLGWTAVSGELQGEPLLLFLIIFVWTPPHFWALAINRVDEYTQVKIPMLPVTHGIAFTKLHILLYTILLILVTCIPFLVMMSGVIYLFGALTLGGGFLFYALKLYCGQGDHYAMKTFNYSIFYLGMLFAFLLLDHYAPMLVRAILRALVPHH